MIKAKLNNQEYFEQYLKAFNTLHAHSSAGLGFVKDTNSIYQATSPEFNLHMGGTSQKTIIGKNDYQVHVLSKFPELISTIVEQDRMVQLNRREQAFLSVNPGQTAYVIRKYPIINPSTHEVVGLRGVLAPFLLIHPLNILYKMHGLSFTTQPITNEIDIKTTERQHLVLFLTIFNYSSREISEILNNIGIKLSAIRINDHIQNLKYIFRANSKDELVAKALAHDYHLCIPRKLLKIGTFPLQGEVVISLDMQKT